VYCYRPRIDLAIALIDRMKKLFAAYFTYYTNDEFSNKEQEKLVEIFRQLDERKCKVMMTNSNSAFTRELMHLLLGIL
jgi:site-specific DNA-adenine methylase